VVVVAPATAVAGAATTTSLTGHALFASGAFPGAKREAGVFSLFSGAATHVRSGKIYFRTGGGACFAQGRIRPEG